MTIQSQILDLMNDLKKKYNMGIIMITHDLGVVAEVCSRVVVMYLGQVIEEADVHSLFENPLHPYTKGLMKSIPQLDGDRSKKLYVIEGKVPSLHQVAKGCRFASRCDYADQTCEQEPVLESYSSTHQIKCWHYNKIKEKEGESHVG